MRRFLIWIVGGLFVLALVAGDLMMSFATGAEASVAVLPPVATSTGIQPARVHVAQEQRRQRRTLLDMLFGNEPAPAPPPRQEQQPVQRRAPAPVAALPPPPPAIEKAPNATRLAVMGDSMAVDVARGLERFYAEDPNLVVVDMGVGSSGFVREDYFDWNGTLREEIAKGSFDLAVVIIGINDRQNMTEPQGTFETLTPGWGEVYQSRVRDFVQQLRAANKPVIWVGLPPMSRGSYNEAIVQINAIQRLAAFGGGAEFLDIYERFLDEDGNYSSFGPDLNGQRVRMRKDDGIHFSTGGADKLAFFLSQSIKLFYRGGGGVGYEVADPLAGTDAQIMVRPPFQGLGQTRLLEVAGAVVPLTHAPRRAAELISFEPVSAGPAAFALDRLVDAPAGRADAFGIGNSAPTHNPGGR